MSQENVEVMLSAYDAIARRDRETLDVILRERLAPDFEFEAVLTGATYAVRAAVCRWPSRAPWS